uniref:Uncharacterized protein n=1 Tax=Physcomitrium patens TaxID=3218 RepID=A0A2K1KUV0_PHYPA|nr:hypothetical protein PHYPA_004558 [Physcomitrium patens]
MTLRFMLSQGRCSLVYIAVSMYLDGWGLLSFLGVLKCVMNECVNESDFASIKDFRAFRISISGYEKYLFNFCSFGSHEFLMLFRPCAAGTRSLVDAKSCCNCQAGIPVSLVEVESYRKAG